VGGCERADNLYADLILGRMRFVRCVNSAQRAGPVLAEFCFAEPGLGTSLWGASSDGPGF